MLKPRLTINRHSLQWKFLAIMLLIALCVMAISLRLCYDSAVRTIENTTADFMNEYIRYADDNLSAMISSAAAVSLAVSGDREIVAATVNDASVEASYDWFMKKKSLESFLAGVIADKPFIRMASVAVSDGRIYQSDEPLILRRELNEPWFRKAVERQALFIRYEMELKTPRVIVSRPISVRRGLQAAVLLELDQAMLVDVYSIRPLQAARILVYTPEGDLFFANGWEEVPPDYLQMDFWPDIRDNALTTGYQRLSGERSFVVRYRSAITGLSTVGIISERALISDAMHIIGGFFLPAFPQHQGIHEKHEGRARQ